jgi:autotransporter-associated beta strand protein
LAGASSRGGDLASDATAGSVLRLMGELNVGGGRTGIGQRDGVVEYAGGASTSYTLSVTNTARLAANNGIGSGVIINLGVSANATLDLNGFSTSVESVTRNANTTWIENNGAADSVLTVTPTADRTYSGGIRDNSGSSSNKVSLVKDGSSSYTLSGNSTYTGATTVSAGTLLVSGALGNTAVTVGASATIGGTGLLGGSLTFDGAAFLGISDLNDPLAVTGSVSFGSGFGIDNIVGIDWLAVDLGTYTLLTNTADFSLAGLDNFGLSNAYNVGGGRSAYFQNGSLQLVVIPEPGAALLGGIGTLLLLCRRRI